jgi:hypothetical protein
MWVTPIPIWCGAIESASSGASGVHLMVKDLPLAI